MKNKLNLALAKKNQNDEFYTLYEDIEKEINHYKKYLKNKVIYCNCDNYKWSNFTKYFINNFKKLNLKKLICTCYPEGFCYIKTKNHTKIKILKNGSFSSPEATNLLKESDIIISNPPFSKFIEYITILLKYKKKFLIIGNKNALTYKIVYTNIQNNKIWLGIEKPKDFLNGPTGKLSGKLQGLTRWFTNIKNKTRNSILPLKYSIKDKKEPYEKYINYDAININSIKYIPNDYSGVMGVPVTFLDKYCPLQFSIIKFRKGKDEKDLLLKNKSPYFRILIKIKD